MSEHIAAAQPFGAPRRGQVGGALLVLIAGLLVTAAATMAIRLARQVEERTDRFVQTQAHLQRIRVALHAFAASHGHLPCPANGALDTGVAAPVVPATLCTSREGTVPWVALGLSAEDALDAWGRKISYRVYDGPTGMTIPQGANMADCDSIESAPVGTSGPNHACTAAHDVLPGPGTGTFLDPALRPGLTVRVGGVNQTQVAWVLISHGASGRGAWLPGGARVGAPISPDELANTRAPSVPPAATQVYVQRDENVDNLDPVSSPLHFDDLLLYERIESLILAAGREARDWPDAGSSVVGAPSGIGLDTATLDSVTPVSYAGRDANTSTVDIDAGAAVGLVKVSASGGNISRDDPASGSAIGVCNSGCGNAADASLSGTESLSFRLQSRTAGKIAVSVLSLDPTVELSVTFRRSGADLPGAPYVSPVSSTMPGTVRVFADLEPSPAAAFDEVVVRPRGSSRFFIASIRFCATGVTCN